MRHVVPAAALILSASFAVAQSTRAPRPVPGYDQSLQVCYSSANSSAEISQQLEGCKKAAEAADTLPANALARVSIYTAAANAFSRNNQFQEALRYANKAVDSSKQVHDTSIAASSAYAARAGAETGLGQLDAADEDQSIAEDFIRADLRQMDDTHVGEFNRGTDIRALKSLLNSHAQMLTAQGKTAAAQAKTDEAAKLP